MSPVELHLWTMPVGGRSPRPALEKVLRPFLATRPELSIRIWVVPWGTLWDRLMSALKGRHGAPSPDVMQIDAFWTGTLASLGLLKELERQDGEGFPPTLRDLCRLSPKGGLYAVPWGLSLRGLHLRREALMRAGMAAGELGTWEGVRVFLDRAARARAPKAAEPAGSEDLLAALAPWVWGAGGDFFSGDGRRPAFLSAEALRGAAFYGDLLSAGPAAGLAWRPLSPLTEPGTLVLPPPAGPAGRFSCLGGGALAMAASTRHADESAALLAHLAAADVQRAFAEETSGLPSRTADAEKALEGPALDVFRHGLSAARGFPPGRLLGSFERLLHRHLAACARDAAPWEAWRAAVARASVETEHLLSLYEPASV
jgi:ABC-type glycerol-3-phosphate transport system substrate-binding protein